MHRNNPLRPLRAALGAATLAVLAACGGGEPDTADAAADVAADLAADDDRAGATAVGTPGSLQLVTTATNGAAATVGSTTCAVSADGRLVLFHSDASNLVAGDSNRVGDLFLKDLAGGALTRVTTQSSGAQLAAGGNCLGTTMTPDGRVVVFNSGQAVFAKNTQTGTLSAVSPAAGTVPRVSGFFGGVVSDDGSKVVFLTLPATAYVGAYQFVNLVPARLMLRDLGTGGLLTLPTDNGKVAQGEVVSNRFAISPDGQRVAFVSSSATLVAGDTNGKADLFVRHLGDGSTLLASSTSDGVPAVPVVSGSAAYWRPMFVSNTAVAFGTGQPSSLGERGLYLKQLASGALSLVLSDLDGGAGAVLSGDARHVAFTRLYSGYDSRVFVRDRSTGAQALVSASASGVASNGSSVGPVISRDGTAVAFGSSARNLVSPQPPAGVFQVYAKTVGASATARQ